MFKFKLMAGVHSEGNKVFKRGEVFESNNDLTKHNKPGEAERFLLLSEAAQAAEAKAKEDESDAFKEMTVAELKSYAAEGEIDLSGAYNKADIIARIKEAE
jgi:hypothetical protein